MTLRTNIKKRLFIPSAFLSLLCLVFFISNSFAEPGVKITSPVNGSTVTPGQRVAVKIVAVGGFKIKQGVASIAGSPTNVNVTSLPMTFTDTIPTNAIGSVSIDIFANDAKGSFVGDAVTLKVQQTATLQSLSMEQDEIWVDVDWDGNISVKGKHSGSLVSVSGLYSDGVTRDITYDPNTTYTSSDPSIVSINSKGDYQVYKVGQASVTVDSSGISKIIPVVFHKPSGIKPSQTVPPTTQIDIQPPANAAGWYNKDIAITITAQAHQPNVVQSITYQFPNINALPTEVGVSQATIPFTEEGSNLFRYYASDNECNESDRQEITFKLDKTPPVISLALDSRKTKLSYSAVDNVSGVKDLKAGLVVPDISSFKTQLIRGGIKRLILNKTTKRLIIIAPNPKQVLGELKTYNLFLINNNRTVRLSQNPKIKTWQVIQSGNSLIIIAPSIVFRARAQDNADNTAVKDIPYMK